MDFVLHNGLRRHDFRLDATPETEWGDRVEVRGQFSAPLLAPRSEWGRWSGTLFASAPRLDVAQLGWYVALPFELNQGRGAARAWVVVRQGRWRELTADLALAAKSGGPTVGLDGCSLACVKTSLARHGLAPALYFDLSEHGVRKRHHADFDPVQAQRVFRSVAQQIARALPARAQRESALMSPIVAEGACP